MKSTLVLLAHPALDRSRANAAMLAEISELEDVTVHDLYAEYPDFMIDVRKEQELLETHQRIVLQHPFFWYSTPALMKEWFDLVLEYGWAYGSEGNKLRGKSLVSAITTGGGKEAYCSSGYNHYSVEELLRPIEQTAKLCGMNYEPPFVFYGALSVSDEECERIASDYRKFLEGE